MNVEKVTPVIMCGGSGTRLWPVSRKNYPKQFANFFGERSLLEETCCRVRSNKFNRPILVHNIKHKYIVENQLKSAGIFNSINIAETNPKGTSVAILLSAMIALKNNEKTILVLSSDHYIGDNVNLMKAVDEACDVANKGYHVCFGVKPVGPNTEYGYIKKGCLLNNGAYAVNSFIEKPNKATAQELIRNRDIFWNAGIFVFNCKSLIDEFSILSAELVSDCDRAITKARVEGNIVIPDGACIDNCLEGTIDYDLFEKTKQSAMVELDTQWSDLGTWPAIYNLDEKDENRNVIKGNGVFVKDVKNSYLNTENRTIVGIGLDDVVIVDTVDATLIAKKDRCNEIKSVVQELTNKNIIEATQTKKIYRPWGTYETIARGELFQVKKIVVLPGQSLSLQKHFHRSEHWVVVKGTAEVRNGDKKLLLNENQSTYIPFGVVHRLSNPGIIPIELIEVQVGTYLGEDDIVRLDDTYGRN